MSYFEAGEEPGDRDPALNETGLAQARAQLLAEARIDLAVCTGLRHTQQTARLAIGGRELAIDVIEGLSEAKTGSFEDVENFDEMETLWRQFTED